MASSREWDSSLASGMVVSLCLTRGNAPETPIDSSLRCAHAGGVADFVDVMLRKCDEALGEVETIYTRDVASHDLSDDLLYDIRTVVQDCQSALDATATRVKDKYLGGSSWRPYFPLGIDPADFATKLESQLKGVAAAEPGIAQAFERHQPYQPGKTELGYLHKLARANKHSDFSEQTREETRRVVASSPGGGTVAWTPYQPGKGGVIFGGGGTVLINGVPVNPATQLPVPSPTQTVVQHILVGWNFVDPPIPVLPTLKALVQQVRAAVADIGHEADL